MEKEKLVHIITKKGHGVRIPCVPEIVLARKLAFNNDLQPRAYSSAGLIDLDDYLQELQGLNICLLAGSQMLIELFCIIVTLQAKMIRELSK